MEFLLVGTMPVDCEIKGTCYNTTPHYRTPGRRDSAPRVSPASVRNWMSFLSLKHARLRQAQGLLKPTGRLECVSDVLALACTAGSSVSPRRDEIG
jgi:hypothetical protein